MSRKHRKKRNKVYQGEDAASPVPAQPVVHRYKAEVRNPASQWWYEHKKTVKIISIVAAVLIVLVWIIVSGIGLLIN